MNLPYRQVLFARNLFKGTLEFVIDVERQEKIETTRELKMTIRQQTIKVLEGYRIAEVYKSGEKKVKTYRGPKPLGYNVYANGRFQTFLPYTVKLK